MILSFLPVFSLLLWRGSFSEVLTPPFSWTLLPLKEVSYTAFSLTVLLSFHSSLERINKMIEHLTPPDTSRYLERGEVAVNAWWLPKLAQERRHNSAIMESGNLYTNCPPASPSLGLHPIPHTPNPSFSFLSPCQSLLFPSYAASASVLCWMGTC